MFLILCPSIWRNDIKGCKFEFFRGKTAVKWKPVVVKREAQFFWKGGWGAMTLIENVRFWFWGLGSNYVGYVSSLESKPLAILCETNLDDSVYFAKLCEALTSFNSKRLCYQCLVLQFLLRRNLPLSFDHLVCLCAQFFVLFHLAWLTFSISAVDNVCVFGVFNVHPND